MNEHVNRLILRNGNVRIGTRFGRLRVLGAPFWTENERGWREPCVVCECTCHTVCVVECPDLHAERAKSCGCLRSSLARAAR